MDERESLRRPDARERTRHDVERLERRASGGRFWQALTLVGSVGWPIVLLSVGGALFGSFLDRRAKSGIHFTLALLTLGTALGTAIAYRTVRKGGGA